MKHPIFKSNTPINQERISFIELVVTRLARRARKKAIALITPYPISNAVFGKDVRGVILRYMFPCEGTITKGLIVLGRKPDTGVSIGVKISNDIHVDSKGYIITRKSLLVEPGISVDSGDRLEISINPVTEKDIVTEAWTSFLWIPSVRDIEAKSFLIDELEEGLLEFQNNLLEEGTEDS